MCVNLSPLVISCRDGSRKVLYVPCNHCVECLKKRQNDWKLRLCHEASSWSHCYFFTLTYREDTLPCNVVYEDIVCDILYTGRKFDCVKFVKSRFLSEDGVVIKSTAYKPDVQLWLKRMREDISRSLGKRWECKYFICAEYGPNPRGTKRPHYHGVLFCNETYDMILPYFNEWKEDFGRIQVDEVGFGREDRSAVANYISKYCAKGCFESRRDDISYGHISKAWAVMSKNIASEWLEKNQGLWERYVPYSLSLPPMSAEDVACFMESGTDDCLKVRSELNDLILHLKVPDGDFSYNMPRYYYDRLFNNKISYEIPKSCKCNLRLFDGEFCRHFVFSGQNPITYSVGEKKVTRYTSESFISLALAYRLRELSDSRLRFSESDKLPFGSDAYLSAVRSDTLRAESRKMAREYDATAGLLNFYETNMWLHREFDD